MADIFKQFPRFHEELKWFNIYLRVFFKEGKQISFQESLKAHFEPLSGILLINSRIYSYCLLYMGVLLLKDLIFDKVLFNLSHLSHYWLDVITRNYLKAIICGIRYLSKKKYSHQSYKAWRNKYFGLSLTHCYDNFFAKFSS